MNAGQTLQFDHLGGDEGQVRLLAHVGEHGVAGQDLAADGFSSHAGSERNVPAEQVSVALDRGADVHTDSHPDRTLAQEPVSDVDGVLDGHGRSDCVASGGEGHHESVALGLHDVPVVGVDRRSHQPVVRAEHLDPLHVTELVVEHGGVLDVGEQDRHPAIWSGKPGQLGLVLGGPAGEALQGRAHHDADAFLAHPGGGVQCRFHHGPHGARPRSGRNPFAAFQGAPEARHFATGAATSYLGDDPAGGGEAQADRDGNEGDQHLASVPHGPKHGRVSSPKPQVMRDTMTAMPSWKRSTVAATPPPGVTLLRDGDLGVRLESLMANATEHIRRERELLIGGAQIPQLPHRMSGRPMLVVNRKFRWQAELAQLKRWIDDRDPVLIGVANGVEAILDAGYKPDVAIGTFDEISNVALTDSRHVVVSISSPQAKPPVDRFEKAGVDPSWFVSAGKSADLALLLAEANAAVVIVEVGAPAGLRERFDGTADQVASSFVTRLRVSSHLVDADAVGFLSVPSAPLWPVLLLLVGGVVSVAAAIAATPVGSEWMTHVTSVVDTISLWIRGLTS